jgi:hypothetical protein
MHCCALCLLLGLVRPAVVTLYSTPICWEHVGQVDIVRIVQTVVMKAASPKILGTTEVYVEEPL